MATKTNTPVKFVKVPTKQEYTDYRDKDGALIFVESERKIYVDDIAYGFSDSDVADKFVKLTGDKMTGDLTMSVESGIQSTHFVHFDNETVIQATGDGGLEFKAGDGYRSLITLKENHDVVFDVENILGIPEPTDPSSPISKNYLEGFMGGLIGVPSGIATLDTSGKVPSTQLPSYVDDVKDYNKRESFPATGEPSKLYLALDTGDIWRWSGSTYVRISDGTGVLVLGNTSSTAFRGDYGDEAYTHSLMVGQGLNPHGVTAADVGLGSVGDYGIASKAQAESGASDILYMTPQKTKNAIEKLSPRLSWDVVS